LECALGKWISHIRAEGDSRRPDADVLKEREQLRKENRILRDEREVLKKATAFFAGQKK
jgi:transposase